MEFEYTQSENNNVIFAMYKASFFFESSKRGEWNLSEINLPDFMKMKPLTPEEAKFKVGCTPERICKSLFQNANLNLSK